MKRIHKGVAIPVLALTSGGAVALSLFVGSSSWSEVSPTILWDLRLPHALLAWLVGASLGTAGVIFQGLFRNPLADPFVVGVSGGASLGAVVAIVSDVFCRLAESPSMTTSPATRTDSLTVRWCMSCHR